jgi:recombination protein RecT
MDLNKVLNHAKKFSKTFKNGYGIWKDEQDAMALKTVLKLNLSKNAPLSIDLQKAIISDQAVVVENGFNYIDNKQVNLLENNTIEEDKRTLSSLESVLDLQNFKALKDSVPVEVYNRLEAKFLEKEQELLTNQK